ncbi:DMT family transporter [Hydrogenophaga sp. 5NK40-0174]|uniref:DMT family transporter n=1 Tax=Hydrogenophaga sp. 5NK40-0174 TaxID=3127649 RepID=UPI00333F1E4A
MNTTSLTSPSHSLTPQERKGMWLGVLGVTVFALTLPMTRMATGDQSDPQLSPWFVTWARGVIAGALSLVYLTATRSRLPAAEHRGALLLSLAGNAIGFPLLLGWALRHISAGHAAVFTALLPLATAAVAAWLMHQRARMAFWVYSASGSVLVVVFSLLRSHQAGQGFTLEWADLLLVGAVISASLGYVGGAKVTPALGAERTISWVCVMALPATLTGTWLTWPAAPVATSAWLALLYVGAFSMWAGFFAWFRGLALGGALRVSQTQLLQPFISILAAVPLLGEPLSLTTLIFALAVVATVFLGRRAAAPVAAKGQR